VPALARADGVQSGDSRGPASAAPGLERWWVFSVVFALVWTLTCFALAKLGGWKLLAAHYTAQAPFLGGCKRFRSVRFARAIPYIGCVAIGASADGLYFEVPLLRLAHAPLLIPFPWSDVTARAIGDSVELAFARAPGSSIRIHGKLAHALLEASSSQVQIQPAA
jgi:hypothetical protein